MDKVIGVHSIVKDDIKYVGERANNKDWCLV